MSRAPAADREGDLRWMRRAMTLARRGKGTTYPNPMVGAVVVRDGRVIGEGFHRRAGTPHAEIHALAGLGSRSAGATLYVTLEPCCHTGRTAPCTAAVIAAGIARVVVAVRDPNPLVDGRGLARLRRAGILVDVGCLQEEARALNRPFFVWITEGRPLVTLKAAMTLDGFMAPKAELRTTRAPAWITGPEAREQAHVLRAEHDAVLVGAGTVKADDPRLTVRLAAGARTAAAKANAQAAKQAAAASALADESDVTDAGLPPRRGHLRVVLDGNLRTPVASRVLRPGPGTQTLVIGAVGAPKTKVAALRRAGAEVLLLPGRSGRVPLAAVLAALGKRGVQSLLVEGGAAVHRGFLAAGLIDRVAFFYAPKLLGEGVSMGGEPVTPARARRKASAADMAMPAAAGHGSAGALELGPLRIRQFGRDILVEGDAIRAASPSRSAAKRLL